MQNKIIAGLIVMFAAAASQPLKAELVVNDTYVKLVCRSGGNVFYTSTVDGNGNRRQDHEFIDWADTRCGKNNYDRAVSDPLLSDPKTQARSMRSGAPSRQIGPGASEVIHIKKNKQANLQCNGSTEYFLLTGSPYFINGFPNFEAMSNFADKKCGVGNWSIAPKDSRDAATVERGPKMQKR